MFFYVTDTNGNYIPYDSTFETYASFTWIYGTATQTAGDFELCSANS